jgi:FeS assembly SUF system regulator
MIRLTRQSDYGILILAHMAANRQQALHNARDLSDAAHIPLPMVSKILKMLMHQGLLASHRGAHGGYSLARDPERISLAEVIGALEGPVGVVECIEDAGGSCELEPVCRVRSIWQRINLHVRQALSNVSLAQMVEPVPVVVPAAPRALSLPTTQS